MTNNPNYRAWFVDLSPDPSIKRRVLVSSARTVAAMGRNSRPNTSRCIPDNTEHRFWVYAADANEAHWEALRLAGKTA